VVVARASPTGRIPESSTKAIRRERLRPTAPESFLNLLSACRSSDSPLRLRQMYAAVNVIAKTISASILRGCGVARCSRRAADRQSCGQLAETELAKS
jgi:hypothetical protein